VAKKRILIVEDDVECAVAYRELLEDDYDVALAHDGTAGLKLITEADPPFDLLILDMMMPSGEEIRTKDMGLSTGLETMRELDRRGLCVPTIVVSVVWEEEVTSQIRACGARAVLQKPVRPPTKLLETVAEIIG
jgi:CheY-like chemotaxis protein